MNVGLNDIALKLDALSDSLLQERKEQGPEKSSFTISNILLQEIENYLFFAAGVDENKSAGPDYFSKIIELGVMLMREGYPSIDKAGLLPTSYIIAKMLVDTGFHQTSEYTAHLEEHLTLEQQAESTVIATFVESILEPGERIVYLEYGTVQTKRLVSKIKRNGIVLTNRRLLFVGCDIDTSRPSSAGPMYVMVHPAIRIGISPPASAMEAHARFYYADVSNKPYFSSVDYIGLNHLQKIKIEKDGSFFLKASKDFQVQFSLSPANLNRPFVPVEDYRLANPECDIYVKLHQESENRNVIEDRIMKLKDELERAKQEFV